MSSPRRLKVLVAIAICICLLAYSLLNVSLRDSDVVLSASISPSTSPVHAFEDLQSDAARPPGLDADFLLLPSAASRPIKPRAVMTLLTSGSSDPDALDFYSANAILQTFMFLHFNDTRFTPAQARAFEFVVMITPQVPVHVRAGLLEMGARLIFVPPISIIRLKAKEDAYQDVFTKFQMWRLEGLYDSILFVDVDFLFLRRNPVAELWDFIEAHDRNASCRGKPFFGAAQDCCQKTINSGLFLFRPALEHYRGLINLIERQDWTEFPDQKLLDFYWKNVTASYTKIPGTYNFMQTWMKASLDDGKQVGMHHKFWLRPFAASYPFWQKAMYSAHLPHNYEMEMQHRQQLADLYAQAIYIDQRTLPDTYAAKNAPALLTALRHISWQLLQTTPRVTWVLVLDQYAVVSTRKHTLALHAQRVRAYTASLGVYWDCAGTRAGAFWVHRRAALEIAKMVRDLDALYGDEGTQMRGTGSTDEIVWKMLLETFASSTAFLSSRYHLHQVPGSLCRKLLSFDALPLNETISSEK
ncbi:hypothetical protein BC830DRAFT_342758 [Chytriomyces sp. MP71]|nr:hypothetical protein BC830DRAFT_342758 [Chytriomyces sp. MP71]